jgi:hypothetical protein
MKCASIIAVDTRCASIIAVDIRRASIIAVDNRCASIIAADIRRKDRGEPGHGAAPVLPSPSPSLTSLTLVLQKQILMLSSRYVFLIFSPIVLVVLFLKQDQ